MNRWNRLFLLVLAASTMGYGCHREEKPPVKEAKAGPVAWKLGAALPLTGNLSFLGEPGKNAITLAVDEINAGKQQKIDPIYYDTQGEPKGGVSAMQKATGVDNVPVVITTLTGPTLAAKPVANGANVLQCIIAIYPDVVKPNDHAIRVCYDAKREAQVLVKACRDGKLCNLYVLSSRDSVTEIEVRDYLVPQLRTAGVTRIEMDTFDVGQKDMKAMVQKFAASGIRDLMLLGYGSDFPAILRQLKTAGAFERTHILGGIGYLELPDYIGTDLLTNAMFVSPAFNAGIVHNAVHDAFVQKYKEQFHKQSVPYDAAFTYDAVHILSRAIGEAGSIDPTAIRNKVVAMGTYAGAAGDIKLLANGDTETNVVLAQYKGKQIVPITGPR